MLLYGKPVTEKLYTELKEYFSTPDFSDSYVVNIFIGDNPSSDVYVRMKQKAAAKI